MHSRDLANVNKCSKDKSYSAHLKQLRRNHGCPYIFMSQLLVCWEGGGLYWINWCLPILNVEYKSLNGG